MADSELQGAATDATPVSALSFILPFVLYLVIGAFEPKFQAVGEPGSASSSALLREDAAGPSSDAPFDRTAWYIVLVLIKFLAVGFCLFYFFPIYRRCFPLAFDGWGVAAGILGAVLWIGLCGLSLEPKLLAALGMDPATLGLRSQFNPFQQIGSSIGQISFLAARFAVLLVIVPLAEEIFLRGFLMRMIQTSDWSRASLRDLGWPALICGSAYGVLTHPSEAIAALVWFSLVSFLMVRTGKFWNCVVAHAVTNALLGIYVITFGQWHLW